MKVIDTLSEGFGAANRRLWIVAIPILFDVFLWLGPKATVGPHLAQLAQTDLPAQYGGYEALFQQIVSGFNLFSLAAIYVPSLVVRLDSTPLLASFSSDVAVNSPLILLGLAAGTVLAGLWLACFYLGLIAQVVRDGQTNVRLMARAVWRYWRRLIAFLLLSVAVIASNFWAAITLIGLTYLITLGLPIAWQFIAAHPAGMAVGIIGNAYIGTGVAAAGFLFYQERLERLKSAATSSQEIR